MNPTFLNERPLNVYVILAEELPGWQSPASENGKEILMKHYAWGASLKDQRVLLMAGPMFPENKNEHLTGPITGLIILNVKSREEAEAWAFKDPFHLEGYRKNSVHLLKITASESSLFPILAGLID